MAQLNYGRHLPAFILLFLAKESTYGSALLSMMKENMPFDTADGPAVYRALNELEKSGAVEAFWDTSSPGAAKKRYTITEKGIEQLKEFRIDIEQRKRNLEFFLSEYESLNYEEDEK